MATMKISLPDRLKAWIEEQVAEGKFSNTSDYVGHLIRHDQERKTSLAALRNNSGHDPATGALDPHEAEAFRTRLRGALNRSGPNSTEPAALAGRRRP